MLPSLSFCSASCLYPGPRWSLSLWSDVEPQADNHAHSTARDKRQTRCCILNSLANTSACVLQLTVEQGSAKYCTINIVHTTVYNVIYGTECTLWHTV